MMNNLQKDLQENVEKYNGKHHLHKKVKVINCYHCYPISTEANIPDNFIKFWDWISIFYLAKSCTSLTLFYFDKVIKARAGRNRNAIISNISELCQIIVFDPIPIEIDEIGNSIKQILIFRNNFEEKVIKIPRNLPLTSRSESLKILRKFKSKYSELPKSPRIPKSEEEKTPETKEFSLIQLYDLETETESSLTNKSEEQKILFLIHIRFLKLYLTIHFYKNLTIINNKLNYLKGVRKLTHQKKIHQIVKLKIVILNLN